MSRPTTTQPQSAPSPAQTGFWTYENKLVLLFFFAVGIVFFDRLAINFLMPFIQADLGLNNAQVGMLAGAAALTWSISSVIGGRLSDKVKSKRMFLVTLILTFSVASMLQGLVGTFTQLVVLRLLMGMFEGPAIPTSQSVLAIESSPHRRGFNLGLTMNTANGLFGSILAPVVIVALAQTFDWRVAFFFTVVPGLIIAFFVWKVMREPQARDDDGQAYVDELAEPHSRGEIRQVLGNRNVILSVIMFGGFMVYLIVLQVYGPLLMTNMRGMSPTTMSLVMSAFGLGTALWGFIVPMLSDRFGRKPISVAFGLLSVLAPLSIVFIQNTAVLALAVFVFAAGMGVGGLAMSVIPAESVPPAMAGLAVGIPTGLGEFIGGFLSPVVAGVVADAQGLPAALFISAGGALIASLTALFLKETAPAVVEKRVRAS
ncbi:MFS transporter [Corynebacterium guangdongense]|uniref:MFS family permease n=1 Tax=Corynebacterium guangdongense TaxID=1783348 RepID=A0ABU1ZYS8_9CORY|nr:MFS transporter [Corynebacterium guangdongense]MDR7330098.1 MFS family permease [Corynebacterium guangdongense]